MGSTQPATFGDYIRAIRQTAGISQLELARLLETHPETISRWENHHHVPKSRLIIAAIERLGKRHGLGLIPRD